MGKVNNDKHVVVSEEVHRRLKLFSAKYNLPMRLIVEWFVLTLITESGEPDIDELRVALDIIKSDERIPQLLKEYKRKHKLRS